MNFNKYLFTTAIFCLLFFVFGCNEEKPKEKILAKVGDKEITVREFLWRSELTIRPNNFKDKSITLNNLISEKILAIKAENEGLELSEGEMKKIQGLKEQAMRDSLYELVADQVPVDTMEVNEIFKWSTREYELEFYQIRDKELVSKIDSLLTSDPEKEEDLFTDLQTLAGKKPIHKVTFKDDEDYNLLHALYSKPLNAGDVVGPVKLKNGVSLIMRVEKWVDYPLFGEEQKIAWQKVKEKVHQAEALKQWDVYRFETMLGKKIEFNGEAFVTLAKKSFEYYTAFQKDSLKSVMPEIPEDLGIDLDLPFFTIDDNMWTIKAFKEQLKTHPLVFRTKSLNEQNYPHFFRLAVIDMVTDHYLTQDAYDKSLDELDDIQKLGEMWTDHELARNYQKQALDKAKKENLIKDGDPLSTYQYWQSYISDLQNKNGQLVTINKEEFDKIKLTTVDYLAIRAGVPYAVSLPNFPLLISSGDFGYIKN